MPGAGVRGGIAGFGLGSLAGPGRGFISAAPRSLPAEFKEHFKLFVNRAHRGLRRVLQNKGIKFEVVHKG